mgnify:CR=1 FL=1
MIRNSHSVSFREKFSRVRRTRRNQENFSLLLAVFSELMLQAYTLNVRCRDVLFDATKKIFLCY